MKLRMSISGPQGTGAGAFHTEGTLTMLELLKAVKKAAIPASYVFFDSWFSPLSTLHAVKSIGLYSSEEMADVIWIQAFQMLLQMFQSILKDNIELTEEKINELVDAFMNTVPVLLKTQHQAV